MGGSGSWGPVLRSISEALGDPSLGLQISSQRLKWELPTITGSDIILK